MIKIQNGKIWVEMGEVPNPLPESCAQCDFRDDDSYSFHRGCGGYEEINKYGCELQPHLSNVPDGYHASAAHIFKTCPLGASKS